MRRPYTQPKLLKMVPSPVRSDSRGPYLRAVALLAVRELFFTLSRDDQEDLLDELVSVVIATDGTEPSEYCETSGDHEGARRASGISEPCNPSGGGSFPH